MSAAVRCAYRFEAVYPLCPTPLERFAREAEAIAALGLQGVNLFVHDNLMTDEATSDSMSQFLDGLRESHQFFPRLYRDGLFDRLQAGMGTKWAHLLSKK